MRNLKVVGFVALLLFIIYGVFFLLAPAEPSEGPDALSFSNTSTWDEELLAWKDVPLRLPINWEESTDIPSPPVNTSSETRTELDTLVSYKTLRTEEAAREIEREIDLNTEMGGYSILSYLDLEQFPATAKLFEDSFSDLGSVIMRWKHYYDRVRPHVLEPAIAPLIDVPGHPAYPSGHATQAYFIAYVMSELRPEAGEELLRDAARIAKNREIAGVHYPSDSEAGRILARQFAGAFLALPETTLLLEAAQQEWQEIESKSTQL